MFVSGGVSPAAMCLDCFLFVVAGMFVLAFFVSGGSRKAYTKDTEESCERPSLSLRKAASNKAWDQFDARPDGSITTMRHLR